jgi:hypothetical protein
MLSRPIGVVWAGWESNTHRLQQGGWELAVEYDVHRDMYRLMIHSHQGALYGLSNATYLDKRLAEAWNEDMPKSFQMQGLARSLEVIRHEEIGNSFANFHQIDATPQMVDRKIERIEDFNIFQTITTRADEIIIEKADMSVIEHLQAIKDLQSFGQEEIRNRILDDRARGENASPDVTIHTNIVQLRPVA